jgi:hypothetical protein
MKVSNVRRNATSFETAPETESENMRAGWEEIAKTREFSTRKRLGKGDFSSNAATVEKIPYLNMDMRGKKVALVSAKKMRLDEVKVRHMRRNGIRSSVIEEGEGDELPPEENSQPGRGDGVKVSNVVRNGSGFESLEVVIGLENHGDGNGGRVEKDKDERLAWMWAQGWRARLRGAGDLVEKCRY